MQSAPLDTITKVVLRALYELAELDCPAEPVVLAKAVAGAYGSPSQAQASQLRAKDIARVLLVLDARGLVFASRARLTMRGLLEASRIAPLGLAAASWLPAQKRRALQLRVASMPRAAGSCGRA